MTSLEPLHSRLFWLHVKKSAGTYVRARLGDAYCQTPRDRFPCCFNVRPRAEWNDILNNYRVPLGDYQFRRSLYARENLYPEWDTLLRLAFVREPVSRCVSMFHYLYLPHGGIKARMRGLEDAWYFERRLFLRASRAFDLFLDLLERRFDEPMQRYDAPRNLHFTTHTARMWDDVVDLTGQVLINRIWRLESLETGVARALEEVGLAPSAQEAQPNEGLRSRDHYRPTLAQRMRIEKLYAKDFDLYESALRLL